MTARQQPDGFGPDSKGPGQVASQLLICFSINRGSGHRKLHGRTVQAAEPVFSGAGLDMDAKRRQPLSCPSDRLHRQSFISQGSGIVVKTWFLLVTMQRTIKVQVHIDRV